MGIKMIREYTRAGALRPLTGRHAPHLYGDERGPLHIMEMTMIIARDYLSHHPRTDIVTDDLLLRVPFHYK